MRKVLIAGLAALALAFVAILAFIWVATGPGSGPPPAPSGAPPAQPLEAAPSVPGAPIDPGKILPGGIALPPPVIVKDEPAPPPTPGSWEAVPILASRHGGTVLSLGEEVQARLSECFDPAIVARFAGKRIAATKDAAPLADPETTLLLLQVEVARDQALVVEAPVESRGNASDGTIACAQAALRNQTAPAGGLPAGRHRVRLQLVP